MAEEFLYTDMEYCTLCDRYFPGEAARAQHVQVSLNHPFCAPCNRRFANKHSLRHHWVYSPRHHYCAVCERDFDTAAGLRVHVEFASVHRDDSDDEDDDLDDLGIEGGFDENVPGWEDAVGRMIYPEENVHADDDFPAPPEEDDDEFEIFEPEDEWFEDHESDYEEDRDAYHGFAPVPLAGPMRRDPNYLSTDTIRGIPVSRMPSSSRNAPANGGGHPQSETGDETSSSSAFNCPLCLEPPTDSSATRCGHVFCTSCIQQALSVKRNCPVCRKAAVPLQLRKIYLSAD